MSDLATLSALLFSETKNLDDARGIANVVLNRMKRPKRFGATLNDVVYAPSQFSGVNTAEWNKAYNNKFSNKDEEKIYKEMISIASQALKGQLEDTTGGADHYVNLKLAQPSWSKVYKQTGKIGEHTYYSESQPKTPAKKTSTSFKNAFREAREQGLKEFEWRGKKFTTEVK